MLNLREYRRRADRLYDYLPWGMLIAPGVILNKDGAFMSTLEFRGPDLASSTPSMLMAMRAQLNHAHKGLGSSWCLHIEARREPSPHYPGPGAFPDPVSRVIDQERRRDFEREGRFFESRYFATFTYLPPTERVAKILSLLIENAPRGGGPAGAYRAALDHFNDTVEAILKLYRSVMPMARRVTDDDLMTYLHACVSTKHHHVNTPRQGPECPAYLDCLLTDDDLTTGFYPMLGAHHMRVVSVRAYPKLTEPGLFDRLNDLGIAYRWASRFLPLDKVDALRDLDRIRKFQFQRRKNAMALINEAINKTESPHQNPDALHKARAAEDAMGIVGGDYAAYGYYTVAIILTDPDEEAVAEKARLVESVINNAGFVSKVEQANAVDAWLGSLPGHAYSDIRRVHVSTQSFADLFPMSAVWAGPTHNEHLTEDSFKRGRGAIQPTLMFVRTTGSTPFRLSLHYGDVAHTQIVGPTGSGKSVLLTTLALQHLRYPDARVIFFDAGASSRSATLLARGQFYNLSAAKNESDLTFQPLARLHDASEIEWATGWIEDIVAGQGVRVDPQIREEIYRGALQLSTMPPRLRTLTNLWDQIQNDDIKAALLPFTLDGSYGDLLDSSSNQIADCNWLAFEMGAIMKSKALIPTLTYIFHALEALFDGRPTMLVLDEAWMFIGEGAFATQINDWLKTLRRKNVGVIFATQSFADITGSAIAPALLDNCPTKIYLPNRDALSEGVVKNYTNFGLNARQINLIATAVPKRDYYYTSPNGNRLFDMGLGPVTLTVAGSNDKVDQILMDELLAKHGRAGFEEAFFKTKAPGLRDDDRREMIGIADALRAQRRAA